MEAAHNSISTASEAWKTLYLPVLLGITGLGFIIDDNVIDPPGAIQGTSGIGLTLLASASVSG